MAWFFYNKVKTKIRTNKKLIANACLEYILFVVKLFLPKVQSTKKNWDLDNGQNLTQWLVREKKSCINSFLVLWLFLLLNFFIISPFSLSFAMFVVFECAVIFFWHPILDTRISVSPPPPSRLYYPSWNLNRAGLESSGQIAFS